MATLDEFAAALERASAELNERGALDCAEAAGKAFLGELKDNTPVLTGALRDGERINGIFGSGNQATANISTHTPVYASFRETGGTIHVKHATVLTDGEQFFGKSVTQSGSHYMARTVQWAEAGGLDGPVREVIQGILRDAGL